MYEVSDLRKSKSNCHDPEMPFCSDRCRMHRSGQLGVGEIRHLVADRIQRRSSDTSRDTSEDDENDAIRFARLLATWFGLRLRPERPRHRRIARRARSSHWRSTNYAGVTPLAFAALALLIAIPGLWAADAVVKQLAGDTIVPVTPRKKRTRKSSWSTKWSANGSRSPEPPRSTGTAGSRLSCCSACSTSWKPPPVRQLEKLPGAVGIVPTTRWPEFTPRLCCSRPDGSIFISPTFLWPFADLPNPVRRLLKCRPSRPSRAVSFRSAAKALPASDRPAVRFGEATAPIVIGSDSLLIVRVPEGAVARRAGRRQRQPGQHPVRLRYRHPDRRGLASCREPGRRSARQHLYDLQRIARAEAPPCRFTRSVTAVRSHPSSAI